MALGTVASLIDPGAFVLGGGVSSSGAPWRATVEQAYLDRAGARPDPPPLLWATLGSDAGIIGAAVAHRQHVLHHAETDA
jgi:glucokinase